MPDDRELAATKAPTRVLEDTFPGMAATDEAILDQQTPLLAEDQPISKRPLGPLFWIAMGWLSLVVFGAVFANVLPLTSPTFQNYAAVNAGPSIHHLLGTDDLGRDLLSRVVFGSRVSLVIGFASVAIGMLVGGSLGLLSGYKGGAADTALNAGSFVILAFPGIVAVIAIVAFWGTSLLKLTIIFGVGTIPVLYRVVRASTLAFANRDFVIAARTLGASTRRIIFREILPNVAPVALTFALINVAVIIVLEGSLAFLGLSIALPTPSWGNIIAEGTANNLIQTNPYIMMWPALAMFLLLLSINLIGDRLRQRFDIREGLL